ncbi:hypothetical protein FLL45_02495 [Aliikangiella marina]|uniref:Uncharacterized protein n=1 Tax=Aliikangiella marina TaxID=1712262 RepID=A0A545TI13_9GAMM|nr:hypothetical protein [Aliikangiella marina]TQV76845.1 hypothetical protein FLL45_02495 [Aliikangiella marina]
MKRANFNLGFNIFIVLVIFFLVSAIIGFGGAAVVAIIIALLSDSGRYLFNRIKGKTDYELNPAEYNTETISIENGMVLFGGEANYKPIRLDEILKVSHEPTEYDYQEITFTFKDKGGFVYSLNNSADYVCKVVKEINHELFEGSTKLNN